MHQLFEILFLFGNTGKIFEEKAFSKENLKWTYISETEGCKKLKFW